VRITGGTIRGRRLIGPKPNDNAIRPTSDRVREAIFNILASAVSGKAVLDLFAGTGAFGLDALSRGAESVVFVDRDRAALELIARNLKTCCIDAATRAFQLDLRRNSSLGRLQRHLPEKHLFNLVFLDPPYEKKLAENLLKMIESSGILADESLVIVEERQNQKLPTTVNRLRLTDQRRYGKTGLWFYAFCS
jgi:16S rRNA (guanine966-N2)-methyltransferase